MVTDNLLEFLNDFQKFALKIRIQQILDTMVKDDRVHEVKEEMACYDWFQCFEDILTISGLEFNHEVILEAANQYNRSIHHLNKALLKLKEKLNEEKDQ